MNPLDVKKMRHEAGLSSANCADLVGLNGLRAWQRYEQDGPSAREIPEPTLRLFYMSAFGMPRMLDAAIFAARAHKGQVRKGVAKDPYIVHPLMVARLLVRPGLVADPDVLTAAVLHDVIEDCGVTKADLQAVFGPRVARLVEEVSHDGNLAWEEKRRLAIVHARKLSPDACALKLADMAANAMDLRLSPPLNWKPERFQAYRRWMLDMAAAMPAPNKRLAALLRAEAGGRTVD